MRAGIRQKRPVENVKDGDNFSFKNQDGELSNYFGFASNVELKNFKNLVRGNQAVLKARFKDAEFIWCQEEPKNQGGWSFVEPNLEWSLNRVNAKCKRAKFIGRAAAASPATGLATQHKEQQETIINEALTIN